MLYLFCFQCLHYFVVSADLCILTMQTHPKDADFLNKLIENYQQMQIIFGNGLATGKFAMGSNEALGSPSDFVEGALLGEGHKSGLKTEDVSKLFEEGTKNHEEAGGSSGSGGASVGQKRKRSMLSEEDTIVLTGMTAAVNNVVDAIRHTKVDEIHPELYGAVMYMPGFTEEALLYSFSHLVDNKAQGTAFVGMSEAHRVLWLRTFLTKCQWTGA